MREWNFLGLVMMLAGPVGLFLMAHLLFPSPVKGANLKEYYYGAMRPLWWLAAATVALATTFRPLIFDVDFFVPDNATSVALLTAFVTLALSKNKALHAVLVPSFFFLILLDIFSWNYVLGEQ